MQKNCEAGHATERKQSARLFSATWH
jgi:hypothetical protein